MSNIRIVFDKLSMPHLVIPAFAEGLDLKDTFMHPLYRSLMDVHNRNFRMDTTARMGEIGKSKVSIALDPRKYIQIIRDIFNNYEHSIVYYRFQKSMLDVSGENGDRNWKEFSESYTPTQDDDLVMEYNGTTITNIDTLPIMRDSIEYVGEFTLTDKALRVSDPCYEVDVWCAKVIDAKPGKYHAYVLKQHSNWTREGEVAALWIMHDDTPKHLHYLYKDFEGGVVVCNAGVDSGQCGFYDDASYPRAEAEHDYHPYRGKPTWYRQCCDSNGSIGAGIIQNMGVTSQTFEGDGGYDCFVRVDQEGLIVAALLDYNDIFGRHSDEEDEDDEDQDYFDPEGSIEPFEDYPLSRHEQAAIALYDDKEIVITVRD